MNKLTNNSNIPLAMAVWLVNDNYDHISGVENYISATRLMKPIRQIILPSRVPEEFQGRDLEDFIPTAIGNTYHDSIEKAWMNYAVNLKKLGYPDHIIEGVLINPTPEEIAKKKDPIVVYLEQRAFREINGYTIGGKLDNCIEGILHDYKSTSAYSWLKGTRDEDFIRQGSIYKWLNPDKVTEDFIKICFIFTDWQRALAKQNPAYPQSRILFKDYPLMSEEKTEAYLLNKLNQLTTYWNAPEHELPECTDEELWRSDPVFKYYSDPSKTTGRSTKNFDSMREAIQFQKSKGGIGTIISVAGEVKRCNYCDAFPICTQKDRYFRNDD